MQPTKTAGLSIISNTFVVLLKLFAGVFTGSVAIISEAIHSLLDLMASIIAYFSVRIASKPPDRDHPYGHGKFENVAGTIETLLIFIAGIWIIYESISKLLHPEPIRFPMLGVTVMLAGAGLNFIVGNMVKRVGEKINSVAMRSNALHLLTDVYSSLGVAVSLLLVSWTNWYILDPIIGMVIAVYIMKEAYSLGKESFLPLLDTRLTKEEEERIKQIIHSYRSEYIEYHDLRTRRSGAEEHIDFHLVVASDMVVKSAHHLCDRIEKDIQTTLPHAVVFIHLEPEHERIKPTSRSKKK